MPSIFGDNEVTPTNKGKSVFGDSEVKTPEVLQETPNPKTDWAKSFSDPKYGQGQTHPTMIEPEPETGFLEGLVSGVGKRELARSKTTQDFNEDVAGGFYNSFWNLAEKGAALTGAVIDEPLAENFAQTVPQYEPNNEMISDTAGIVGSLLVGTKGVDKVAKVLGKIPSYWQKLVAGNAFPVAGMDIDDPAVFTGDDAYAGNYLGGFTPNDPEDRNAEVLTRTANHLLDAFVAAGIVDGTVSGIAKAGKLLNDFIIQPLRVGNMNNMSKDMVRDSMVSLQGVLDSATPEQKARSFQELVDILKQNKNVLLKSDDAAIPDITINRDVMSAIETGAKDENLAERARRLRTGLEPKSSELAIKLAQPGKQATEHLNTVKEVAGGDAVIQQTGEGIQTKAIGELESYKSQIDATRKKIDTSEKGIKSLLENDPTFREQVQRAAKGAGLDIGELKTKSANEIVDTLDQASEIMTKRKNEYYDAIPNNAQIDPVTFGEARKVVDEYLSDGARKKLDQLTQSRKAEGPQPFNEGMGSTPEALGESQGTFGANFKDLDTFANTTLANDISSELASLRPNFDKIKALRDFKRHINKDQLAFLIESGDDVTQTAARKARDYFVNDYAPYWRDGPLEDIQDVLRTKRATRPKEAATESRAKLEETLDNPDRPEYQGAIVDLLNSPDGKNSSGKVVDYVLGSVARDVQSILRTAGKLSTDEIVSLSNKYAQYQGLLKKTNPDQAKRLENFFTSLRDKNVSTKELTTQLEGLEKGLPNVEKEIFGNPTTKGFFRNKEPVKNVKPGFKDIFTSPNAVQDTEELLSKGTNPKGVEASFAENLSNFTLKDKKGKTLSSEQQLQYEELKKTAEKVFEGRPAVADMTFKIIEEAQKIAKSEANKFPVYDTSNFRKQAGRAVEFLVTQIFGPLDRTGSRVRSAAGRVLGAVDPSKDADLILGRLIANADEFEKIAQQVINSETRRLTKLQKKTLQRIFSLPVLYADRENKEERLQDETNQALAK